jgi:hypothetical protein
MSESIPTNSELLIRMDENMKHVLGDLVDNKAQHVLVNKKLEEISDHQKSMNMSFYDFGRRVTEVERKVEGLAISVEALTGGETKIKTVWKFVAWVGTFVIGFIGIAYTAYDWVTTHLLVKIH